MKKTRSIVDLYPFFGQETDKIKNVFFKSSFPEHVKLKNSFVDIEFNTEKIRKNLKSVSKIKEGVIFKNFINQILEAKLDLDILGSFEKWEEKASLRLKKIIDNKNQDNLLIEYPENWEILWEINLLNHFKGYKGSTKDFFKGVPFEKLRYLLLEGKTGYPNYLIENSFKIICDWEEINKENLSKDFNFFKELITPELEVSTEEKILDENKKSDFFRELLNQQKDFHFKSDNFSDNAEKISSFIFNLIRKSSKEKNNLDYFKKHLEEFSNIKLGVGQNFKVIRVLIKFFSSFKDKKFYGVSINDYISCHYDRTRTDIIESAIFCHHFMSVMLEKTGFDFSKKNNDLTSLIIYNELTDIKDLIDSKLILKKRNSHFFKILKEMGSFGKFKAGVFDVNELNNFNFGLGSFVLSLKKLSQMEGGENFFSFYQNNDNVINTIKNLYFSKVLIEIEKKIDTYSEKNKIITVKLFNEDEVEIKMNSSSVESVKRFFEYSKSNFDFMKNIIEKMELSFEVNKQNKKINSVEKTKSNFSRF